MKFIIVEGRWVNADEIRVIKIEKCYKEKYYVGQYFKAILTTKYGAEYVIYSHEDKNKVLDYIDTLLKQLNAEVIDSVALQYAMPW